MHNYAYAKCDPISAGQKRHSKYILPKKTDCIVKSLATFRSCKERIMVGDANVIRFDAMINCKSECKLNIKPNKSGITLYGSKKNYGLTRTGNYTSDFITVRDAKLVTIVNLTLDDSLPIKNCNVKFYPATIYPCGNILNIINSKNVLIGQVNIASAQNIGVNIDRSSYVKLVDSKIRDAKVFGIRVSSSKGVRSKYIEIRNNKILNSRANGIYLEDSDHTKIANNIIANNHYAPIFPVCGRNGKAGNELCPGGQLDIVSNNDLTITNNLITKGNTKLKKVTGRISGIELTGDNVNILIANNKISLNAGNAIYANPGSSAHNFNIRNNVFASNGQVTYNLGKKMYSLAKNCVE